jgi:hypothetical protein
MAGETLEHTDMLGVVLFGLLMGARSALTKPANLLPSVSALGTRSHPRVSFERGTRAASTLLLDVPRR